MHCNFTCLILACGILQFMYILPYTCYLLGFFDYYFFLFQKVGCRSSIIGKGWLLISVGLGNQGSVGEVLKSIVNLFDNEIPF